MKRPRTKEDAGSASEHKDAAPAENEEMAEVAEVPSETPDSEMKSAAANAGKEDFVDFSQLVGVGEDSDESDVEDVVRFLDVSKLPAQVLSEHKNDEAALHQKLGDIALFDTVAPYHEGKLPFRESLSVTLKMDEPLNPKLAVDDLARERRFAELATDAVHKGLGSLRELGVKFRRPDDYFAQMIKTDSHMTRVKTHLLDQKENIQAAQKQRNNRDIVRNKKQVRQEQRLRTQEKQKQANDEIAAVTRLRKERVRRRAGADGLPSDDDDFPIDLLNIEQLDSENRFASMSDITSGKKKPWTGAKGSAVTKMQKTGADGKQGGPAGIKKKRGAKKRLGKSRRQKSAAPKTK